MKTQAEGNPFRKDVITDEFDNIVVDTCVAFDTHEWETGVKIGDISWKIVEQYDNREQAVKGHNNWVKKLKKNPNIELPDINTWGL